MAEAVREVLRSYAGGGSDVLEFDVTLEKATLVFHIR